MARLRSPRSLLLNASGNTGQAPDKHPMPQARRQRPGFRIFAQPSADQCVYAQERPQRFCRFTNGNGMDAGKT